LIERIVAARDGAAGEGDMHHARHHDVVDKLAAAGQQAWIFLAANALAYVAPGAGIGVGLGVGGDLRVGRGDGAHDFSPGSAGEPFLPRGGFLIAGATADMSGECCKELRLARF